MNDEVDDTLAFTESIAVDANSVFDRTNDADVDPDAAFHFSFRKLFVFMGPGFLMSVAYLDPGNLEADISSGAIAGYSLLWLLLLSTTLGYLFQTQAIKLGVVTGSHLAQHCRQQFRVKWIRVPLWLMTEIAVIGSDIQEVLGSAVAIAILSQGYIPLWAGTLITAVDTFTFLFLEEYGVRKLEAFFCTLIAVMSITFGVQYFTHLPPQMEVLKGTFIPVLPEKVIKQAVGTVGSVIMPHNLYLHSAVVLSRTINRSHKVRVKESLIYNYIESGIALLLSFCVNAFVVCNFAHMDYTKCNITPNEIGLSTSGDCMRRNYGDYALYLWAFGLLASGQSSTCSGTYTGQFVMQGFLNMHMPSWKRLLITRCTAIVPALTVAMFYHSEGMLDVVQESLNVLQSMQLPFALLPLLYMTTSPDIMGENYVNSRNVTLCVWFAVTFILGVNAYLVADFIQGDLSKSPIVYVVMAVIGFFYIGLISYLVAACCGIKIPTDYLVTPSRMSLNVVSTLHRNQVNEGDLEMEGQQLNHYDTFEDKKEETS